MEAKKKKKIGSTKFLLTHFESKKFMVILSTKPFSCKCEIMGVRKPKEKKEKKKKSATRWLDQKK